MVRVRPSRNKAASGNRRFVELSHHETRVAIDRDGGIDAFHETRDFVSRAVAPGEEADGFGQGEVEERHEQQRKDAARDKDGTPAEDRDDRRGHEPDRDRARDESEQHDRDHQASPVGGRVFRGERNRIGQRAADAEASQETEAIEHSERAAHCGQEAADPEKGDAGEQDRTPSEAVGERGDQNAAKEQAERAGGEEVARALEA